MKKLVLLLTALALRLLNGMTDSLEYSQTDEKTLGNELKLEVSRA